MSHSCQGRRGHKNKLSSALEFSLVLQICLENLNTWPYHFRSSSVFVLWSCPARKCTAVNTKENYFWHLENDALPYFISNDHLDYTSVSRLDSVESADQIIRFSNGWNAIEDTLVNRSHRWMKTPFCRCYHVAVSRVAGLWKSGSNEAVLTSTHNLLFQPKKKKKEKNNVYPGKPYFFLYKVSFSRVFITRTC